MTVRLKTKEQLINEGWSERLFRGMTVELTKPNEIGITMNMMKFLGEIVDIDYYSYTNSFRIKGDEIGFGFSKSIILATFNTDSDSEIWITELQIRQEIGI